MKQLKVIVIGAGGRGRAYSDIMAEMPEKYQVIGVAEPLEDRMEYMKNKHQIAEENCVDTWEKLLERPKFADIAIISTMDRMHKDPAIAAIRKGYDLLLEKPVAPTAEDCLEIEAEAKKYGVKILVCHVLRYNPLFTTLKKLIDDGEIGKVMSIHHSENVGNTHQSHSFVRGNWGNSERSSTMLLQKSCHDMDILQWLVGKPCKRVSSFGSLTHFVKENAPEGATEYCLDGCPHQGTCFYDVQKLYIDDCENWWFRGAATQKSHPTDEDVIYALKNSQYGKCAYKCDNDVVDHQIVNLEFEDGTLADFNMCAFNEGGRFIRIMGTKGEISNGSWNSKTVDLYRFSDRKHVEIDIESMGNTISSGHGGGDVGIVNALYDYLTNGVVTEQLSEIGISVKNHMIVFAAEESRKSGKIISLDEFKDSMSK